MTVRVHDYRRKSRRRFYHWTENVIQLTILLSLLRVDWTAYFSAHSALPELQEMVLGQTIAQLNRPDPAAGPYPVHPKSVNSELLLADILSLNSELAVADTDITTLLLDNQQLFRGRQFVGGGPPAGDNDQADEQNNNASGEPSSNEAEQIAVAVTPELTGHQANNSDEGSGPSTSGDNGGQEVDLVSNPASDSSELTIEDMELIDALWQTEIDMGVAREHFDPDFWQQKESDRQREQQKLAELKKEKDHSGNSQQQQGLQLDSETGEWVVPCPRLPSITSDDLTSPLGETALPQSPQQQPAVGFQLPSDLIGTVPSEELNVVDIDHTLADCLDLFEEEEEAMQSGLVYQDNLATRHQQHNTTGGFSQPQPQPRLASDGMEQQWADLASLSELRFDMDRQPQQQPLAALAQPPANQTLQPLHPVNLTHLNFSGGESGGEAGAYALNATTNGNVNLLNATDYKAYRYPLSPASGLANMNLNGSSDAAPYPTATNFTYFSGAGQGSGELAANLTGTAFPGASAGNDSLLDQLLSDPTLVLDNVTGVVDMIDDADSAVSLGSGSADSPMSDWNETSSTSGSTGASGYAGSVGYSSTMDQHTTGMSSGYFTGKKSSSGHQYGGGNGGGGGDYPGGGYSGSFAAQYNITHNHTYSQSGSPQPGKPGGRQTNGGGSGSKGGAGGGHRMSRDQRRAFTLKLPLPIEKIVNLPVDDFNEMISKYQLNDAQLNLVRDIRRRGKNKVAAQNCRKRKLDVIHTLNHTVTSLADQKEQLTRERRLLDKEAREVKQRFGDLYREVFRSLRDESGRPYDPDEFCLQQSTDGNVFLVPKNAAVPAAKDSQGSEEKKGKKKARK